MTNTTQRIGAALLVGGLFAAWIGEHGLWLGVAGLGLVLLSITAHRPSYATGASIGRYAPS